MQRPDRVTTAVLALALLAGLAGTASADPATVEHGVYQYVIQKASGRPAEIAETIAAAAPAAGFQVLARVPVGTPGGCGYTAAVVALYAPEYGRQVLALNRRTGPFGVVDRVNVFEDEQGVHVLIVNPRSVLRTVLMEDVKHDALIESHLAELRALVTGAVKGEPSSQEYGQLRSKGYIGKTMGVVAGGPFDKKVEDVAVVGGYDWKGMAGRVRRAMEAKGETWGLRVVYALELPEAEAVVLGTTGTPMDSKSFEIVGGGADADRAQFKCPGLAHAGAYPIEVVVANEGPSIRIRVVDTMYRMKMFFEDAGKWAFMKNMGMPGSIQDEIAQQVRAAVATLGP